MAAGANVNIVDINGSSVLMMAIAKGKDETLDQLLNAGADSEHC